jgi:PAS domain-containing protein
VNTCDNVADIPLTHEMLAPPLVFLTRQKELERERDEHATLLTSLIATMADAVLVESDDGRVLLANDALCRLFDLDRSSRVIAGVNVASLTEHLRPWIPHFKQPPPLRRRGDPARRWTRAGTAVRARRSRRAGERSRVAVPGHLGAQAVRSEAAQLAAAAAESRRP